MGRHPKGHCQECGEPLRGRTGCLNCDALRQFGLVDLEVSD